MLRGVSIISGQGTTWYKQTQMQFMHFTGKGGPGQSHTLQP